MSFGILPVGSSETKGVVVNAVRIGYVEDIILPMLAKYEEVFEGHSASADCMAAHLNLSTLFTNGSGRKQVKGPNIISFRYDGNTALKLSNLDEKEMEGKDEARLAVIQLALYIYSASPAAYKYARALAKDALENLCK